MYNLVISGSDLEMEFVKTCFLEINNICLLNSLNGQRHEQNERFPLSME